MTTGDARTPEALTGPSPAHVVVLWSEFRFEAAHLLPNMPAGHKCTRLHGHSFRLEVHVEGPIDQHRGMLMDYADIKQAFAPFQEQLDHRYLNDIAELENPTSENILVWIWRHLKPVLPSLQRLVLHETCTVGCSYEGPDEPNRR
jgi:6-pyruvoyltetrahydropterin/6-carboxytetrahydropterin synthase